jgi:secreted trypsin-like serine protease
MEITFNSNAISFCTVLLLVITRSSHQYIYSCNSNATCGCSSNLASVTRIVGGESAGTSTWGWAVSISIDGGLLCGGSILSSSWIITAAHCVSGISPSQVIVYAGSNARFSGQSRVASSVIVHSSYNSSTKTDDIALIRLSTPLTMSSSTVKPICIPSVSSSTLSAGEWPSAGLYVSYVICFYCFNLLINIIQ